MGSGRERTPLLRWAAAAVAPWLWFPLRDAGSAADAVASILPVAVAAGAAAFAVAAVRRRRPAWAGAAVSWAAMGAVAVVGPWLPAAGPAPAPESAMRVVVANMRHGSHSLRTGLRDVLAEDGDIVSLVEAGPRAEGILQGSYPHVLRAPGTGLAVLSRHPVRRLARPEPFPERGERWEVDAPAGRVVLYTVHLLRPHVGRGLFGDLRVQRREVDALLAAAHRERSPVLIVGDINASDRSRNYRRLAQGARDAMRAGVGGPTYVRPRHRPQLLRIDHLFVPHSWCAASGHRFGISGSDHRGVTARVGPCPAG